jgi:hypothetical protein
MPSDPSMSDHDADPVPVFQVIDREMKEMRWRYDAAKFGADPVGHKALGSCWTPIDSVWIRWGLAAAGEEPFDSAEE